MITDGGKNKKCFKNACMELMNKMIQTQKYLFSLLHICCNRHKIGQNERKMHLEGSWMYGP